MKLTKRRNGVAGLIPTPITPSRQVNASSRRRFRPAIAVLNLIVSLLVISGIIYVASAGAGPLPPLGQAFNPGTGVWTAAADAQTPVDETLHLPGLAKPVRSKFEANGTTHVDATSDHDLFLTIGYLHAKFRLFQMDLMRRQGEGLLSAIVGKSALHSDEFEDQLGLLRTAQSEWTQMTPDDPSRQALTAYTQGVNAAIDQEKQAGHLPLMFKVLGYQPAPWTPIDSLVIQGVEAQTLSFSTTALDYALLVKSLGYERTMQWFPVIPINEQHPYDPGPYKQTGVAPPQASPNVSESGAQAVLALLDKFRALPPTAIHHESNSNAWVVDGTKTASGKPMMAGDPHLEHTLPAIWYQFEGRSPHYQFSGVSIPGIPVVIIGYNAHISWSLTNGQDQLTFYYQEKTDAAHPHQYFWNGAWQLMKQIHYHIPVKGGKPDDLTVELTVHGPIITQHGQTMAVWWAGALPSRNLHAMLNVMQSSNYQQFRDALRDWHTPSQTFVYADDKGNIGQVSAGYYPLVKSGKPWLPLSGTGESDVIGSIPFDALPQVYNPPSHFTFSGNQRPVNATYPYYIGTSFEDFDPGFRTDQIYHKLSGASHITVADMKRLQMDTHEYLAQVIVPKLITALDQSSLSSQEQQAVEQLRSWDFDMNVNSAAATIWNAFLNQYHYDVFHPWWDFFRVPENQAPLALRIRPNRGASVSIEMFENLQVWTVSDPTNPAFSLPNGTKRTAPEVMRLSFKETLATLAKKFGPHPKDWTWGKAHRYEIPSLTQIPSLGYGPFPQSGSGRVINASSTSSPTSGIATGGPSWRIIVDWATGKGIGVYPGGQSENPLSPWYENQVEAWQNGQYYSMLNGDQIESLHGVRVWTLQP